jgi:sulfur carrier protein
VQVTINGETRELPDGTTAVGLVELMGLTGQRLAIEVNGEIVPASTHKTHDFHPGDTVEIVHAVGGG